MVIFRRFLEKECLVRHKVARVQAPLASSMRRGHSKNDKGQALHLLGIFETRHTGNKRIKVKQ